ncbi:MAG TPA: hypothetical protein PLA43_03565 [Bryobacteraceae bacterium]|nr:hypothetical protein [Bryobacteraceae bacterium]HOQ47636.1 hypothetical protein [Bryobacteraceae bacterium]HPU71008.1 hypothetical protein [Bryobacteraceae bacterium]
MRLGVIVAGMAVCGALFGQTPEAPRTVEDAERIRALVEAGAAPRQRLDEMRHSIEDSRDEAILRRTLYGRLTVEDLTEEQGREMVAAAERMVERREARLELARRLVEEGVLARRSLDSYIEDLEISRKTLELARERAALLEQLAEMARRESEAAAPEAGPRAGRPVVERYDGNGQFREGELKAIEAAFRKQFSRPLPISSYGATAVHRAMGFDHRGRVDVALDPDQPEGEWLRNYLRSRGIPHYVFRAVVPGRSTGPHIHIGPPSERIDRGG